MWKAKCQELLAAAGQALCLQVCASSGAHSSFHGNVENARGSRSSRSRSNGLRMVPECHGWVSSQAARGEGPSACTNRAIFHLHMRTRDCPAKLPAKWGSMVGAKPITKTVFAATKRSGHRGVCLQRRRAGTGAEQRGCLLVLHCNSYGV